MNFSERNARIVRIMELDELTVQRQRQSDGMAMAEYSGYWIGRARLNLSRRETKLVILTRTGQYF